MEYVWFTIDSLPYGETVLIANKDSCRLYYSYPEGHKWHTPHFAAKDGFTHWTYYTPPV